MNNTAVTRYLYGTALAAAILTAQQPNLGRIDLPTSGPPAAQKRFLWGVLLLHSFEYDDAREEFQAAQKLAPGFAMAYWGEAMTYNEPLWFYQDRESARAALKRFAPTPETRQAKTPTQREKDYLETVEVLFGDGEKEARDFDYVEAMRRLSEKYPDDHDAASFYALSLLGTCHGGRDFRVYMKAGAIVEDVFAKNPQHPGALHYLIHSYDDPIHAPLGLRAARIYAKVAPAAAHALHMPSHIFVAMGMWDEVVSSNIDSWQASVDRARRKNLPPEDKSHHSLWWLLYGYLQQGKFAEARKTLKVAEEDARASPSRLIRFHLAQMRSAYTIETGESYPIEGGLKAEDLDIPAVAGDLLAAGLLAFSRGDRAESFRALTELKKLGGQTAGRGAAGHAAHGDHVYPGDAQLIEITSRQLEALERVAGGESQEAVRLMKEAAAIEDRMAFEFGPPVPPKPAHELFGEILLQLGQPVLARAQFELALIRAPKRALSLLGRARAFAQEGNRTASRQAYEELQRIWKGADDPLKKAVADSITRL